MPSQNFPRPLNQQLDKISDPISTNDVLADALLVTETTYFKGSGSSYTGTVPSNNFKYGVFCVVKRNDASFIVHATSADGTSSNYYDGSAWGGWIPSTNALNANLTNVSSHLFGKGTYYDKFVCSGYISASGNYFSTTLPIATTSDVTTFSLTTATEITIYDTSSKTQYSGVTLSQVYGRKGSITAEFKLPSTHANKNIMCTIFFYSWSFTLS